MTKYIFKLILITLLLGVSPVSAFAASTDCKPLYGGGVTKEQTCTKVALPTAKVNAKATPTPIKAKPTPVKSSTTKGGLPILSPTPTKRTPSTGPEVLGLIALAPAAALGYYLRRKA